MFREPAVGGGGGVRGRVGGGGVEAKGREFQKEGVIQLVQCNRIVHKVEIEK